MKFKRVFIWYALPIALAAVWLVAFYLPLSSSIKAQSQELKALKRESAKMDTQMVALIETKKRSEQARITLEEFQAQLPVVDELPDFVRSLAAAAKKDGIAIDGFSNILAPVDAGDKMPLVTSVFEIDLKGRYLEIGGFVEELGSKKAFKDILIATIGYSEKEYPSLTGRFVVELRAWKGKIADEGK